MSKDDDRLAAHRMVLAPTSRMQTTLEDCWEEMLADPVEAEKAAAVLGIPASRLAELREPPVRVRSAQANAAPADIAMIVVAWLGTEVVLGVFKDMAKDEIKRRLTTLWERHLRRKVDQRLGHGTTGRPVAGAIPEADAASREKADGGAGTV